MRNRRLVLLWTGCCRKRGQRTGRPQKRTRVGVRWYGMARMCLTRPSSPPDFSHCFQCSNRLNWPDGAENKKSLKAVQASAGACVCLLEGRQGAVYRALCSS